jgi:uncharacterized membrane protein HdeD (DUF308 family)
MNTGSNQPVRQFAVNAAGAVWWYFLLRGLLLAGTGLFVLLKPDLSAKAFAQLLGALVLIDGVLAVLAGIMGHTESRLWTVGRGLLMILVGLFVFTQPALAAGIAIKTVLYIIAPFVVFNGIMEIVAAIRDQAAVSAEKSTVLGGALWVAFGLLLFLAPVSFGVMIVRIIGIIAILIGLILLFFAVKFRKLQNRIAG